MRYVTASITKLGYSIPIANTVILKINCNLDIIIFIVNYSTPVPVLICIENLNMINRQMKFKHMYKKVVTWLSASFNLETGLVTGRQHYS